MRNPTSIHRFLARLLLVLLTLPPLPVRAEVVGENVIAGEATVERAGDVTTIHASDGAIIEYDALNVWRHEELHFVQPSSSSRVLNQVSGDATRIEGGLFANGIVYILNPAGVYFGGEAVIDVGGLVAAAGHMEAADFLAGRDRFALEGAVENHGAIEAASVALLGRQVANHGRISAPEGTIALVAGERVLLTRPGGHLHVEVEGLAGLGEGPALEQTGTVDAGSGQVSFTTGDHYSLALNHEGITRGGSIELRAASGTARVAGRLDARGSGADGRGGAIRVSGERVHLEGAELDASGAGGGGEILVGGDLRGQGALPTARRSVVDADSLLRADALGTGDGGRVIVWADEATAFLGEISARGGEAGGDGGFAEVSGAVFLWSDGKVDLGAAQGRRGTLLYDPQDIELRAGTQDGSDDPDLLANRLAGEDDVAGRVLEGQFDALLVPFVIYESEIEGTDANIVLEATNSIFSTETIDVTLLADRSLSLATRNQAGDAAGSTAPASGISLADVSFTTSGTGTITLRTGTAEDAGVTADLSIGSLATGGGAVELSTSNGAIDVNGSIATASATGPGGAITVTAGDLDASADSDVSIAGGLDSRGAAGGAGGAIAIRTEGSEQPFPDSTDTPLTGGGAIAVGGAIDTRGGDGSDGGAGGALTISADGGAVSLGAVDTRGGAGTAAGGAGGAITLSTRATDYDDPVESSDANDITTGALLASGGAGGTGSGGAGGAVDLRTRASEEIERSDPDDPRLADGGGAIAVASVRSDGGAGAVGGAGGSIRLDTEGEATAVDVSGALSSRGGAGSDGAGGAGGRVSVLTQDAAASLGAESFDVRGVAVDASVITEGGQGSSRGGAGGAIALDVGDLDADGDTLSDGESPISLAGALVSAGGNGGSEIGGAGGSVLVRSLGETVDIGGTDDPIRGGGDLAVADIDSRGGDGATGGAGGQVDVLTSEGRIDVGDVDSSGGDGSERGGNAGRIDIRSLDSNQDDANHIVTGFLAARGGDGGTGSGGRGGPVLLRVFPAGEIVDEDENVLQEEAGTGDISVPEGIAVEGGNGGTTGGGAGSVFVVVTGVNATAGPLPTVSVGGSATPAVAGGGGDGPEAGGDGASVAIGAAAGNTVLGAIDTRGGDATGPDALGGDGGAVDAGFVPALESNDIDEPAGTLLLLGNIDAREGASTVVLADPGDPDFGTPEQASNRARVAGVDGGDVFLFGPDGLEHDGQAGPHVRTTGDVTLESGADLGASGTFFVEGEGERRVVLGRFADTDTLSVGAAGLARVEVVNAGFLGGLDVSALGTSDALDIEVVQPGAAGDDRVTIEGQGGNALVTQADGTGNQIAVAVRLRNLDLDARDDGTLVLQTGSVVAGDAFEASSDGDLVIGDAVIGDADGVVIVAGTLNEPDPITPPSQPVVPEGAPVVLRADADSDGTGAVLDAAGPAEGGIDLRRDGQLPSRLIASAAEGIGAPGAPIVLSEGGVVEDATLSPLKEADDFDPEDPEFVSDPDSSAGIYIQSRGPEELDVISARIESGSGDIELVSDADLRISGPLDTLPDDPDTQGAGGDILLRPGAAGRIILDPVAPLVSGGRQTWDGPVGLARTVQVEAGGGLETTDSVDVDPEAEAGGLFATLGGDSRFGADIGATSPLGLLVLQAQEDTDPTVTFDLAQVGTEAAQIYDVDVALARDVAFESTADIFFERDLDAEVADGAAASVLGATGVDFGGNVGTSGRLRGLSVRTEDGSLVRFDSVEQDQSVVTGADGLLVDTGLSEGGRTRVPAVASVARVGGDLLLRSEGGDVILADGEKLSGTRDIALEAPGGVVSFTDVNAVRNFSADAATIRVFARRGGEVRLPGGARVSDAGTDLFANDAIFSVPVTVEGGGETPFLVTPGGTATAAGGLEVVSLGRVLLESDLLPQGPEGVVLDLALPLLGPGFESQELNVDPVSTPIELWVSAERAAPPADPTAQQVASVLGCALEGPRSDCPDAGALPPGSALATPRAAELASQLAVLARSARHLQARRALAAAAADPGASLVRSDTLDYLIAIARWDAEAGLLGLDEAGRAAARQTLLDAVVSGVSSPDLDADLLWDAVESLEIAPTVQGALR